MPNWIERAVVSPASSATTLRPKSIPDVTPPAVITFPSLTTLAFSVRRADQRQQIGKRPMGCRPPPFEQPGDAQNKGARTDRRDIFRGICLAADELDGFAVLDRLRDTVSATRHADQVERGTVRKCVRRHQSETAIAGHRRVRFRDDVDRRVRHAREHLQRSREIELREIGENNKADIEERHMCYFVRNGGASPSAIHAAERRSLRCRCRAAIAIMSAVWQSAARRPRHAPRAAHRRGKSRGPALPRPDRRKSRR